VFDVTGGGAILAKQKKGPDTIIELFFSDETSIASCGPKHFAVWTYDGKAAVNAKKAAAASKVFSSVVCFNKKFVCAALDGTLNIGNDMKESRPLHDKALDCL